MPTRQFYSICMNFEQYDSQIGDKYYFLEHKVTKKIQLNDIHHVNFKESKGNKLFLGQKSSNSS